MGTDFYVAGRWRNRAAIEQILTVLDRAGYSSYCFVRNEYAGSLFGETGKADALVGAIESAAVDDPAVGAIFEEDMAAQRAARRFLVVMPAGNASHIEAGVSYGMGKPCYSVGPVPKTETLYRIFNRMFSDGEDLEQWLATGAR